MAARSLAFTACVDVDYREHEAVCACLLFERWDSAQPARSLVERVFPVAPYVPGHFYLRELPCLLVTLTQVIDTLDVVVVDGYAWLGEGRVPGLGARLYEELGGRVAVIGVAKTVFRGAPAIEVRRGGSERPLYVSAAGMDPESAAQRIATMHGQHRLPTLLRQVDQLSRSA